ncbi:MAG: NADH-quinone oxidoreductase subunit C [Hyphomicrobiales bacterium]
MSVGRDVSVIAANAQAVPLPEVPLLSSEEFLALCVARCGSGLRISSLSALPGPGRAPGETGEILAVLADDPNARLELARMRIPADRRYPSLSTELPQAQAFERELHEEHGLRPVGHPWLKPLRRHRDLEERGGGLDPHAFFRVEGEGIHEVAVGPVHAGIIEPGHFRFQCDGERVLHLEIQLGYQHRGAGALLLRSTPARRRAVAESIAGDTAVGHALAHAGVMEALAGSEPSLAAQSIRAIALELERIANHVGDLGAMCGDIGYLPGASWFGRLRGEFLNLLLELSGNRFGRSLVLPGGVRHELTPTQRAAFLERIDRADRDVRDTAELAFASPSVGARFEQTGILETSTAEDLGIVGPAARASGCDRDVRRDHPQGMFRYAHIPVALAASGDVLARALVRRIETQRSLEFVREQLVERPEGTLLSGIPPPRPGSVAVSLVEGWRGEIVHVAVTSEDGELAAYHVVDPSFHNWFGLAVAMRGNQISDFPLCNKSFNLSYAGHDL